MKKIFLAIITILQASASFAYNPEPLDLSPARWVWYPSERTLQNTFVLFRKEFNLDKEVSQAKGWILADSRYQLFVNGQRVQWGPAPSDPRWQEADPVDITPYLKKGTNVIACQVLFYGSGDGTWAMGKPGFIFNLDVDGHKVISDESWDCMQPGSWPRGQYKRWFLRSLQEEFDARKYPYGWNEPGFVTDSKWMKAKPVSSTGRFSSVCNDYYEYINEITGDPKYSQIRGRDLPMMKEYDVPVQKLTESMLIEWNRPPEEYFDMVVPDAFSVSRSDIIRPNAENKYTLDPQQETTATTLIFEFKEQGVGWPHFTIDAPEGTIVEMLVHEGHKPGNSPIINTHFNSWTRFICKEGVNNFETFDFESFRWLQLHIRNYDRPVTVSSIGMRRRMYPWQVTPQIVVSNDTIQRVVNAAVNTIYNSAQETIVDGMARERQQYSGDVGHMLHPLFQLFGDPRLPARYLNTFSQGSTLEGYFMDCWPGWDRLARVMEREMQLTSWGPILDHGIGFNFDCWNYYMYTGDKEALNEVYPRLIKFFDYVCSLIDSDDNLMPVENIGVCSVWIDHDAYTQQRHKQLAANLYLSAMCSNALAPLCRLFGDETNAQRVEETGKKIHKACVDKFWDSEKRVFTANLPWISEDKQVRYCDRSLATSILFDMCPDSDDRYAVELLASRPGELGLSYPCNAPWRAWALAESGCMDVNLSELRRDWGKMLSVWENNTLGEFFNLGYDNHTQWSHCPVTPLLMLYQGIAGILPLEPGGGKCRIWPKPDDLEYARLEACAAGGKIKFETTGLMGKRIINISMPEGCEGELWLDPREKVSLPCTGETKSGLKTYRLTAGNNYMLKLKYT